MWPIVLGIFEWVQGRVPTPHGFIYANWGHGSNGKIIMDITAPKGTQAIIVPPFPGTWTFQGRSGQVEMWPSREMHGYSKYETSIGLSAEWIQTAVIPQ